MSRTTPPPGDPSVRPTSLLWLAVTAVAAAAVGVVAYTLLDTVLGTPPSPGPAAVWILILGVVTTLVAVLARRQIQRDRRRVEPRLATRWLALAKTSQWAGAALLGLFVAWAWRTVPRADTQAGGPRLWWSVLAAGAGLFWAAAGAALERACRIPRDDDSGDPGSGDAAGPDAPTG